MMGFEVRILADSRCKQTGARLTSFVCTFPRIILAEVNTHRMLSRSSASSRAIPIERMIARVMDDPFIPAYWGKNQKGMQADRELTEEEQGEASGAWLTARDEAVESARNLLAIGVHKQITNRLLEPWMWHTAIISGTHWRNFYNRRAHKDAQPEFRILAEMMLEVHKASAPYECDPFFWHLPFITEEELPLARRYSPSIGDLPKIDGEHDTVKVSCGRAARVSYLRHDGVRDPSEDVSLGTRLVERGHPAPMEHAAMSTPGGVQLGNFFAWRQARNYIEQEWAMPQEDGTHRWGGM